VRVLLLADICNPEWASTPSFAYRLCHAIADVVDEVTLVSHVRNRDALLRHGCGRARLEFVDSDAVAARLDRATTLLGRREWIGFTTSTAFAYPGYLFFEHQVARRFLARIAGGEFDVVHRVSPLSPVLPSPMAVWSPRPVVVGPVNGGLAWPSGYRRELRRERDWLRPLRAIHKVLPYYQSSYRKAAAILAGFTHTRNDLPPVSQRQVFDFADVGVDPDVFYPRGGEPVDRNQVTILFASRLVPFKCADVLLDAFAASPLLRRHRLLIVGEGPERERLQAMIERYQLAECVSLLGWANHDDLAQLLRSADIFALPSIHELGGGIVLEAMASALPCVVVDYGGPANYVTNGRGIAVPLGSRTEVVSGFRHALETLVQDPARRRAIGGRAARYAAVHHSWAAKARQVVSVYRWVTRSAERPPTSLADA
jgi:glycosyltransferase involved in cell wall biosynthesis